MKNPRKIGRAAVEGAPWPEHEVSQVRKIRTWGTQSFVVGEDYEEQPGGLRYADDGADLERPDVRQNVVAIDHTPFVTAWRGAEVILAVVDSIAAIPVLVLEARTFPPIPVFDVTVVVVMVPVVVMTVLGVVMMVAVLGVVVMVLGKGDAPPETGGKDRERQNSVQLFH